MDLLPIELLRIISEFTSFPRDTIVIIKSTNKHLYGLLKYSKSYRMIDYYIKHDNIEGVKWYLCYPQSLQRYRKLLIDSVRKNCNIDLIDHIIHQYNHTNKHRLITNEKTFIRTIIGNGRADIIEHIEHKYDLVPKATYLRDCIYMLDTRVAKVVAFGYRPVNYYVSVYHLITWIWHYQSLESKIKRLFEKLLKILTTCRYIQNKHIKYLCNHIYSVGDHVELITAVIDNYCGPRFRIHSLTCRDKCNRYLSKYNYVHLI
jgi:hypothetical protein